MLRSQKKNSERYPLGFENEVVRTVPIVATGTVMSIVGVQDPCPFQQGSPRAILVLTQRLLRRARSGLLTLVS